MWMQSRVNFRHRKSNSATLMTSRRQAFGCADEKRLRTVSKTYERWKRVGRRMNTLDELREAAMHGAAQRRSAKMMTVMAILIGLMPIMWGRGAGSDVMKRIAAPNSRRNHHVVHP
jgi:Cu/Ag efflux pump CusA